MRSVKQVLPFHFRFSSLFSQEENQSFEKDREKDLRSGGEPTRTPKEASKNCWCSQMYVTNTILLTKKFWFPSNRNSFLRLSENKASRSRQSILYTASSWKKLDRGSLCILMNLDGSKWISYSGLHKIIERNDLWRKFCFGNGFDVTMKRKKRNSKVSSSNKSQLWWRRNFRQSLDSPNVED